MKRPSGRTMFLAHPVIAIPLTLASFAGLYLTYKGGSEGIPVGLLFAATLAGVGKARSEADAYRQWRLEWDAMAGEVPPSRGDLKGRLGALLLLILALGGLYLWLADPSAFGNVMVIGAPAAVAIAILPWWRKRRHRSARPKKVVPVQIVAEPTGPVPTLDAAYAGLPDHLRHLVNRPGR